MQQKQQQAFAGSMLTDGLGWPWNELLLLGVLVARIAFIAVTASSLFVCVCMCVCVCVCMRMCLRVYAYA